MKKSLLVMAVLIPSVSLFLTVGAERAGAQGPAGAGASTAAQGNSNSSGSKSGIRSIPSSGSRRIRIRKIPRFERKQKRHRKETDAEIAGSGTFAGQCECKRCVRVFVALHDCLAALHASHSLGLEFNCLRAGVTGVHTNADLSGCKMADARKRCP